MPKGASEKKLTVEETTNAQKQENSSAESKKNGKDRATAVVLDDDMWGCICSCPGAVTGKYKSYDKTEIPEKKVTFIKAKDAKFYVADAYYFYEPTLVKAQNRSQFSKVYGIPLKDLSKTFFASPDAGPEYYSEFVDIMNKMNVHSSSTPVKTVQKAKSPTPEPEGIPIPTEDALSKAIEIAEKKDQEFKEFNVGEAETEKIEKIAPSDLVKSTETVDSAAVNRLKEKDATFKGKKVLAYLPTGQLALRISFDYRSWELPKVDSFPFTKGSNPDFFMRRHTTDDGVDYYVVEFASPSCNYFSYIGFGGIAGAVDPNDLKIIEHSKIFLKQAPG